MKKLWEVMSRRQWLVPPRVSPFNVNGLIDTLRITFLERQQLHYGKKVPEDKGDAEPFSGVSDQRDLCELGCEGECEDFGYIFPS